MARHLLVTNDYPPKTGGIQVYLHELWRRLEPGRAVVLTASSHRDAPAFDRSAGVVVERVAAGTLFLPTLAALRSIEAGIERHQPDLVLLDPAWPLGLLGPHLSRPYGVILHGAEVAIPGRLPVVASTLRRVLRHAALAVSAGGYPAAEALRNAAEYCPPIITLPPGVDPVRFAPVADEQRIAVRQAIGLDSDALMVSSYSRLVPRKGMDTLIEASAQLRPSCPTLQVVIGGEGRDLARLERLATARRAPVRFLGRVPDAELGPWLASSDLFVMDCRSRWMGLEQEGFGIVFLEAASSGVAQVAGRSGGSHEAVIDQETGLVVGSPKRAGELASAIATLLDDPPRRAAMGARAREVALSTYDWDVLAARLSRELATYDHFESAGQLA